MEIEDFKIETDKEGNLRIQYIGSDPSIDKCTCVPSKKFANYHLIKLLLEKHYGNDTRMDNSVQQEMR